MEATGKRLSILCHSVNISPPRWHVLGVGSIGALFAARIHAAGIAVTLLLRASTLAAYRSAGGLRIDGPDDARLSCQPPALDTFPRASGHARGVTPPRCILACTKAHDTPGALEPLLTGDGNGQLVLLLQNGLGVGDALRERWPRLRLWSGVTTAGAWRSSPFTVHCVAAGETHAGHFDDAGDATLDTAVHTLADTRVLALDDDIRTRLWRKLAVNAVINALTAIHGCRNGQLLAVDAARDALAPLAAEVEAVARAEGICLDEPVLAMATAVIRLTAENLSSMNRDIAAGRRTEIDFINGHLVALAMRHGIDVPRHAALVTAIHALQAGARPSPA